MVWKQIRRILFGCMLVAVMVAMPLTATASTYNPYDGNISTTYITFFEDISSKISIADDYVFFRSAQYEYLMAVGDLSYSNGKITGNGSVDIYKINTNTSYNNSSYVYTQSVDNSFSLVPGNALIYSNLGHFPDFINRGDYYAFATLFLLLVGICLYILRSIFSFCLRMGRN